MSELFLHQLPVNALVSMVYFKPRIQKQITYHTNFISTECLLQGYYIN